MSSVNRRAFVIQGSGDFFTGKTSSGKPDFSMKLSDAEIYSTVGVAHHFINSLEVMGVEDLRVRELWLGVVVNV